MIRVGDSVRLKVGGEPMLVIAVRTACDGTGGDGAGLYCQWWEERPAGRSERIEAWISESAIEAINRTPTR